MEYYLVTKSNEVLAHAKIWLNLQTLCKAKESNHKIPHFVSFCLYGISKIDVC